MALMVTYFPSRFRSPPDPPQWSLCKSRPFKALTLTVPPKPPEPPDVPFFLAPPLQTLESSVNPVAFLPRCSSPVPVDFSTVSLFSSSHSLSLQKPPFSLSQAFNRDCCF
ncbi:uncharacterized protein LOC108849796 isoform X2 [Raphanus sativus]|uniref:Uncharacterized protein LOC108849796 isoform X2 n=1 Tax=Raphanus sativus TaxID=3726 RepID=A0A6J0N4N7_RAPSA|nr:uncharacterized protein LOC108849796 isoform X2 [Raphanus sativus]